jgi:Ca-activated chloride channel family protein
MRFLYPQYFWLFVIIPVLWLFYLWNWNQRRTWLKTFGNIPWPWRKLTTHISIVVALSLAILALTRPQYARQVTYISREGIDIVCGIDVSPSMLAEDVESKKILVSSATAQQQNRPTSFILSGLSEDKQLPSNRLQRVKQAIYDLTQALRGEKVALFLFSSKSSKVLPLSSDYDSLRFYLDFYLDSYHISAKGTDLQTAINTGSSMFREDSRYKILLLFSDGEMEEADALKKALEATQSAWLNDKVRIYTFGIGSSQNVLIPIRDNQGSITNYLKDFKGNFVRTQADMETLNKIGQAGGGQFYHLGDHGPGSYADKAIVRFMNNLLGHAQGIKTIQKVRIEHQDLFPYLFLLALGFLGGKNLIFATRKLVTKV